MNFIAMDFETANRHPESACSLALVMVRNNQIVDRFYTLINPQMPFDARNIQIHDITAQEVATAPTMAEVWPYIKDLYQPGMLVCAHNARFDTNVMRQSLARYDISEPHYFVIDTLRTSKQFEPNLPNHKLNTVAKALNVELWHHHNALSDSEACAGILLEQEKQFGDEAIKNLVEQV
ncbi:MULTISPECIES: 3'-5' exonuclease [unclassified Lactobacillus]|uniref:3'-5' exonuclease n=1 Tax=unclassified Lactobacillus TaxID=2620435 RepID=UPI000EFB8ED7|nr:MULTISPECIES: 3'-5' exonuclease [unclassified Lactobacillus]RMC24210.1 exonuclease [Lactobacillus sp. ESL0247]RMC28783.1 exonuclease [Lactobacillus sp. ESL0246]RMC31440.1 exonuclease [Lactobacillus sp. ESL0245]RMC49106.1 exonuclease [Lactobacillus sp. ESL0228]